MNIILMKLILMMINFSLTHLKIPTAKRGGSGGKKWLPVKDSLQIAEHNIILGLNIPGYPEKRNQKP